MREDIIWPPDTGNWPHISDRKYARRFEVAVLQSLIGRPVAVAALVYLAGVFVSPCCAQTTSGTLIGQVFGQNSTPLGGAKVTVINENNGNTRATRTIGDGSYTVSFLTPGSYTITASLDKYTDSSIRGFIIPLNATTPLRPPRITLTPITGATPPSTTPPTSPPAPTKTPPTTTTTPPTTTTTPPTTPAPVPQSELSPMVNTTDPTRRANLIIPR